MSERGNEREGGTFGMVGAIVGDIVGSRFEWNNRKSKRFTLMKGRVESSRPCHFTDDTVMTVAIADAIITEDDRRPLATKFVAYMQAYGRRFPGRGYGGRFGKWESPSSGPFRRRLFGKIRIFS
jgi:type I restriction enzyme M protein